MEKIRNRFILFFLILNSMILMASEKNISASVILNYEKKGERYLEKNKFDKAEKNYRELIEKSESSKGYLGLATVYLEKKEYRKAIEYSEKALELQEMEKENRNGIYDINRQRDRVKAQTVKALSFYGLEEYEQAFSRLFEVYSEIYDVYGEENIEKFSKNLISLNRKMAETDLNLYKKNIEKMKELEMASLKNEYENNSGADLGYSESGISQESSRLNKEENWLLSPPPLPSSAPDLKEEREHYRRNVKIIGNNVKVSTEKAKSVAFENAKVDRKKAKMTKLLLEKENRKYVYNMIFFTEYRKYEYKIDADTGQVIKSVQTLRKLYADKTKPKGFLGIF